MPSGTFGWWNIKKHIVLVVDTPTINANDAINPQNLSTKTFNLFTAINLLPYLLKYTFLYTALYNEHSSSQ
jgi:hypothetical protein